jgi:hypothetical protein
MLEMERDGVAARFAERAVGERSESGGGRAAPDPELVERPLRRRFSVQYKLRILREAEACTRPGEIGALLRREGCTAGICRSGVGSATRARWRRSSGRGFGGHLGIGVLKRPGARGSDAGQGSTASVSGDIRASRRLKQSSEPLAAVFRIGAVHHFERSPESVVVPRGLTGIVRIHRISRLLPLSLHPLPGVPSRRGSSFAGVGGSVAGGITRSCGSAYQGSRRSCGKRFG